MENFRKNRQQPRVVAVVRLSVMKPSRQSLGCKAFSGEIPEYLMKPILTQNCWKGGTNYDENSVGAWKFNKVPT